MSPSYGEYIADYVHRERLRVIRSGQLCSNGGPRTCSDCAEQVARTSYLGAHTAEDPWVTVQMLLEGIYGYDALGISKPLWAIVRDLDTGYQRDDSARVCRLHGAQCTRDPRETHQFAPAPAVGESR